MHPMQPGPGDCLQWVFSARRQCDGPGDFGVQWQCLPEGTCFADPSYAYLGKLQGQGRRVFSGQSAEVYPLFFHACNASVLV